LSRMANTRTFFSTAFEKEFIASSQKEGIALKKVAMGVLHLYLVPMFPQVLLPADSASGRFQKNSTTGNRRRVATEDEWRTFVRAILVLT
jgi:hypothetical protein